MGEIFAAIGVAVLGSTLVTACLQRYWSQKDKDKTEVVAIRLSLLFNLQNFGEKIVNNQSCSQAEYNQFKDAYDTYKALGGDGYADTLKAAIDNILAKSIEGGNIL